MSTIVLGHPYSGALYAYFADQIGGENSHTRYVDENSYYRILFGSNSERYVDLALTFLLLYDEVLMTPADSFWPNVRAETPGRVPELGLCADWEDFNRIVQHIDGGLFIKGLSSDSRIVHILHRMGLPEWCWHNVLQSTVYELGLALRNRAQLLCTPARHRIIERILELSPTSLRINLASEGQATFVKSYSSLTGLALRPRSLEQLMLAKPDSDVRKFACRFLELIDGTRADDRDLALLMREALERERIAGLFAGALNWMAVSFRVAGECLIGSVFNSGRHAAELVRGTHRWVEFKGSIDRAIEREELIQRLDRRIQMDN